MKQPLEKNDGGLASGGAATTSSLHPPMLSAVTVRTRLSDYLELVKPRIAVLVLIVACVGFCLGSASTPDWILLVHTLLGVALSAGGANALNQVMETAFDRRMARTCSRPIPSGRLAAGQARSFGTALAIAGPVYLTATVNLPAALLAAATITLYLFVYTPLKRHTRHNTLVGAIPGALPPMIGYVAAGGGLADPMCWILFVILFVWQLPHFFAIAWIYRDDYARGGYQMVSLGDADGRRTARSILLWAVVLLAVTLLPVALRLTGPTYAVAATALGAAFLVSCIVAARRRTDPAARLVVLASIIHLPAVMMLMLWNRS